MGARSNYSAKKILDHELGGPDYTRPATVYIALLTVRPNMIDTGSTITEANYTGYARKAVTNNATNFPAAAELVQTPQTSGTLTIGQRYLISAFNAGDNFTNVGAPSNAAGVEFVASGTTPTTWTNGSGLRKMGVEKSNGAAIDFAECTAGSSNVIYFAILDAATVGNIVGGWGAITDVNGNNTTKNITAGDTPRFPIGTLKIRES